MKNLNEYIDFLGLELPVSVIVKTSIKEKSWDAYYLPRHGKKGKLTSHKIVIRSNGLSRNFETILAHELIHAKQEEMKQTEIHGKVFRKFSKLMEEEFGLKEIYIDGVDLN